MPTFKIVTNIPTTSTSEQQILITVQQPPAQTETVYQDNYTQVYEYDDVRTNNPNDVFYSRQSTYEVLPFGEPPGNEITVTGTPVLPTSAGVGLAIDEDGRNSSHQHLMVKLTWMPLEMSLSLLHHKIFQEDLNSIQEDLLQHN